MAASLSDFDDFLAGYVQPWVKSSSCWPGGEEGAKLFLGALEAQKAFLAKAVTMKKPADEEFFGMIEATSAKMTELGEYDEATAKKDRDHALYTKVLAEGVNALAWVTVPTPVPHINETVASVMYSGNKIITAQKDKNPSHAQWVKDFKEVLGELAKYAKAHHTAGVAWGSAAGLTTDTTTDAAPTGGQSVQAYDEFLPSADAFVKAAEAVAPEVGGAAKALQDAFLAQRAFLVAAETHSKPKADDTFFATLAPQVEKIEAVGEAAGKIKNRDLDHHAKSIEEGAQLIAWVSVPTTVPHVTEQQGQVMFYINKILMNPKYKGDEAHKKFSDTYKALCAGLLQYVKEQHKTGLAWGVGKPELQPSDIGAAAPVAAKSGGDVAAAAPAGPPKPAAPKVQPKKVDLKTITAKETVVRTKFPKGEAKCGKEGLKKWAVEHQIGEEGALKKVELAEGVDKSQAVYVYACQYMHLNVVGKVNSITVDSCKGCKISFDSCVGSVEVTAGQDCAIEIRDTLATLSIDKTHGLNVSLSQGCIDNDIEINTSTTTDINIHCPGAKAAQIPELFVSRVVKGNKVETKVLEEAA